MAVVELLGQKEAEDLFAKLPAEIRSKKVISVFRGAGNIVRDQMQSRVPVGDVTHNKGKKALLSTIKTKVAHYSNGIFLIVGAQYPAGAHAHLVESGHEIVVNRGPNKGKKTGLRAVAKPFIAPAIDSTRWQVREFIVRGLEKAIARLEKQNKKKALQEAGG